MCIRDSFKDVRTLVDDAIAAATALLTGEAPNATGAYNNGCLLYTSDAADERSSVDLGGRRIIKKKNKTIRRRSSKPTKLTPN